MMNADEAAEGEDRQVRECRFCFEEGLDRGDEWLAPCLCAGTVKWVHRSCINKWIERVPTVEEKTRCPTCLYVYEVKKRLKPILEWSFPWRVILIKPPVRHKTLQRLFYRAYIVGDFLLLHNKGIEWGLWWSVLQLFSRWAGIRHVVKYSALILFWDFLGSLGCGLVALLIGQLLLVPLFKWSAFRKCITEAVCDWEIADSTQLLDV